jgi:hypothetical protein
MRRPAVCLLVVLALAAAARAEVRWYGYGTATRQGGWEVLQVRPCHRDSAESPPPPRCP